MNNYSKEKEREYQRKYRASERGKAARKKYRQSEKGKAMIKKYISSEKVKAKVKKYYQEHREELNVKRRAYQNKKYRTDPVFREKVKENSKKWMKKNPQIAKANLQYLLARNIAKTVQHSYEIYSVDAFTDPETDYSPL